MTKTPKWLKRLPLNAIIDASDNHGLDWRLVAAIVSCESDGQTHAIRYERHYKWLFRPELYAEKRSVPIEQERLEQMTSWGLMQVMGAVAREYGLEGPCGQMLEPQLGLDYGCRHLKNYYERFSDWNDAISSYNQGNPGKRDDGTYRNQAYVDKVLKRLEQIKGG